MSHAFFLRELNDLRRKCCGLFVEGCTSTGASCLVRNTLTGDASPSSEREKTGRVSVAPAVWLWPQKVTDVLRCSLSLPGCHLGNAPGADSSRYRRHTGGIQAVIPHEARKRRRRKTFFSRERFDSPFFCTSISAASTMQNLDATGTTIVITILLEGT